MTWPPPPGETGSLLRVLNTAIETFLLTGTWPGGSPQSSFSSEIEGLLRHLLRLSPRVNVVGKILEVAKVGGRDGGRPLHSAETEVAARTGER